MKTFFINRFKKGRWLNKSNSILNDKAKMTALLSKLPIYLKKEGLLGIMYWEHGSDPSRALLCAMYDALQ